jgi:hypothetical protein
MKRMEKTGVRVMSKPSRTSKKSTVKKAVNTRPKKNTAPKTLGKVVIKYDVGFNNSFYIRGRGAGLSWDRGILLKNVGPDEWIWEPTQSFNECEFKILINDQNYEAGDNHHFVCGAALEYTPRF